MCALLVGNKCGIQGRGLGWGYKSACKWYHKGVSEVRRRSPWEFTLIQEGKEQHMIMKNILGCVFGSLCDLEQSSVFRHNFLVCKMGK